MLVFILAIIIGLIVLAVSADKFVEAASHIARHYGLSPLLIGMIIIGFGTSAPELIVSSIASYQGNHGLAIGNAYGSNITNIAFILGITALYRPILVSSSILKKELPILTLVTVLSFVLLSDFELSIKDGLILIFVFIALMVWTFQQEKLSEDALANDYKQELTFSSIDIRKSYKNLILGLIFLLASSKLLVWGAVKVASYLGISDLIIGLTIVAVGTSLPEFASSILAAKKGESDLVLGNILGSNLINALIVIGASSLIGGKITISKEILYRDMSTMTLFTVSLFLFGHAFRCNRRIINRFEGLALFISYLCYTYYLI